MLAVLKATAPPWNLPKNTSGTEILLRSAPRRHKPFLFIVPNKLKPWKNCAGTTKKVGAIRIVVIAVPMAPGFTAPSRPLRSTRPRPRLETIVIVVAIGQRNKEIRTWARPPNTTIIKRAILLINALSSASQKTSTGLGNFFVGDWC